MDVTVGVCAYNEAGNIEKAIRSVYRQRTAHRMGVIVVSSGSTDGTDDIVRGLADEYDDLTLISQEGREGKNSAINLMLDHARGEVAVLFNADNVLFDEGSLDRLLAPFSDDRVGIVGGRPVTVNDRRTVAGFASSMLWTMHHHISLASPKIGELIAFRNLGQRLPSDSQSDEDILKMDLERRGYVSAYAPEAMTCIRGPENIGDLMKQRIRVNAGEIRMRKDHGLDIPTWNVKLLFSALLDTVRDMGFHPLKMAAAALLEMHCRFQARKRVRDDPGPDNIWDPVGSTKNV